MAATVTVKQSVGAGPTDTIIANVRFNTDDTINPGTTNPVVRPAAGVNRSFAKTVYLNADSSPTGQINNCKLYSDGAVGWTGVTLFVGSTGTYAQATGTDGETGDDNSVATADIEDFIEATPKNLTGSISNPNTGRITDYVVMQIDISTTAVAGTVTAEILTFQYDET